MQLFFGLLWLTSLAIGLRQSEVRFFRLWSDLDRPLIMRNRTREIALIRVDDSQLKLGLGKFWIETNGICQERFDLRCARCIQRIAILPERDRVVIICLRILRLQSDEAVQLFKYLVRRVLFNMLHFPEKEVRRGIARVEIRGGRHLPDGLLVGATGERGGT